MAPASISIWVAWVTRRVSQRNPSARSPGPEGKPSARIEPPTASSRRQNSCQASPDISRSSSLPIGVLPDRAEHLSVLGDLPETYRSIGGTSPGAFTTSTEPPAPARICSAVEPRSEVRLIRRAGTDDQQIGAIEHRESLNGAVGRPVDEVGADGLEDTGLVQRALERRAMCRLHVGDVAGHGIGGHDGGNAPLDRFQAGQLPCVHHVEVTAVQLGLRARQLEDQPVGPRAVIRVDGREHSPTGEVGPQEPDGTGARSHQSEGCR